MFSHMDGFMADDSKVANRRLLGEIVHTLEGTQDEEVKAILRFMKKCLEKTYPFVQVFHPLGTNFAELTKFVEKKMKAVRDPALEANSGLTLSSQLKLQGEVKSILMSIKTLLGRSPVDTMKVKDAKETLEYIGNHIKLASVTNAIAECSETIDRFCLQEKLVIDEEMERGAGFEGAFSSQNTKTLINAVKHLVDLNYLRKDAFAERLTTKLVSFRDTILSEPSFSFSVVVQHLNKLSVWALAFPDYKFCYDDVVEHCNVVVGEIMSKLKGFLSLNMCSATSDEIFQLGKELQTASSIIHYQDELIKHIAQVDKVVTLQQEVLNHTRNCILNWRGEFKGTIRSDESSRDELLKLSSQAKVLIALQSAFGNSSACRDLKETANSLLQDINHLVVGYYQESLRKWTSSSMLLTPKSFKHIQNLMHGASHFSKLGHSGWNETHYACHAITSSVRSALIQMAQTADEKSKFAKENGLSDAESLGQSLVDFDELVYFDDLFEPEYRFMKSSSIEMHRVVLDRMSLVSWTMDASLKKLFDPNSSSFEALNGMGRDLGEVYEVSKLASILQEKNYIDLESTVMSQLLVFAEKMFRRSQSLLEIWIAVVESESDLVELKKQTEKLDSLIRDMKQLSQLHVRADVSERAEGVVGTIKASFNNFRDKTYDECSKLDDLTLIADRFCCVEVFCDFDYAREHLPSLEYCQKLAATAFSKKAEYIEQLVERTAKWDLIDECIANLEKATAIDKHIGNQASSRLGPLRKLRERKEDDVDSVLADMIINNDYKGIGDLLSPLAQSEDQLKRKKFTQNANQICTRLRNCIGKIEGVLKSNLDDQAVHTVRLNLVILEDADAAVGPHLSTTLDLRKELRRLTRAVDDRLDDFLANFRSAKENQNFGRMAVAKARASLFVKYLGKNAPPGAEARVAAEVSVYNEMLNSVPVQVEEFFNERFSNGIGLLKLLAGLKQGAENPHKATLELSKTYRRTKNDIERKLIAHLQHLDRYVNERHAFDDGVHILCNLLRELDAGLDKHIDTKPLPFDCKAKMTAWHEMTVSDEFDLEFESGDAEEKLKELSRKLDKMKSPDVISLLWNSLFRTNLTYENRCKQAAKRAEQEFSRGTLSLSAGDFASVHQRSESLSLMSRYLTKHVPAAEEHHLNLKARTQDRLLWLLDTTKDALISSDIVTFEAHFIELQNAMLLLSHACGHPDVQPKFILMNKLVHETLNKRIDDVITSLKMEEDPLDFFAIKTAVEDARAFGSFIADHFTIFYEHVKAAEHLTEDDWLSKIACLCHEHFHAGRNYRNIRYFAILGITPSADEQEIRRAYRARAKTFHPDKSGADTNAKFRAIKEAQDILLETASEVKPRRSKPFDESVLRCSEALRRKTKECLNEGRYVVIDRILYSLPGLFHLKDLVDSDFDPSCIQDGVEDLVRNHVNRLKVGINTLWSARQYRELNDTMADLRTMEDCLKSHARVFSESWSDGIVKEIEDEISRLAREAGQMVSSKASAKQNESEFRRRFLQMGSVLVELPVIKDFTKGRMADVLERCLRDEWGFSYVFELGLSLQRGNDEDDEDTAHVAHFILSSFNHFKEVLTMAWNTETIQKPVQDTVKSISALTFDDRSWAKIDQDALLDSFSAFETHYTSFLGEYIQPGADRTTLASTVARLCKAVQPVTCSGGWGDDVRKAIPKVLGGVFALFTICKSGESFNRIESSGQAAELGQQVLMKPHNIQILTLLYMFGCGSRLGNDMESQLLQIRTGEGKSMILGAAAAVLGLLGFNVRCVCYSEYLSNRDQSLFQEIFDFLGLGSQITYSKITSLSEDTTASKGNIRELTGALLRGDLHLTSEDGVRTIDENSSRLVGSDAPDLLRDKNCEDSHGEKNVGRIRANDVQNAITQESFGSHHSQRNKPAEEILLIDEVDVFFGSEFYGQTYNQVAQIREPEIQDILKTIWKSHKSGDRRLRLKDIKSMDAYGRLLAKMPLYEFVIDNEISAMLDDVRQFDSEPYFLDANDDRIGYKVMDTVCYDVTLGYRTAFAYLKEFDAGALNNCNNALQRALTMNVSCAQFSYANIHPTRILGVSGTLDAVGSYEREVLRKYGIKKFIYMPSVYGQSNFEFEKSGDGVFVESGISDYHQRINNQVFEATKNGRAVIIFFEDRTKVEEYVSSPFYPKLGRKKTTLVEDMDASEKDFVIKKASTSGQITVCSAVFGRGTDFFCKDQKVQDNGGVLIIQTFLSTHKSEEIQIQGRTARQGKRGSYQLVLLDSDLQHKFSLPLDFTKQVSRSRWYQTLDQAREKSYEDQCAQMDAELAVATSRDDKSHQYFDALLKGDRIHAETLLNDIYSTMKKPSMPSSIEIDLSCVIDGTGSMSPYVKAVNETMKCLLRGEGSIVKRLRSKFPDIGFKLRVATLVFRDIEDAGDQFREVEFTSASHFTEAVDEALNVIGGLTADPSGGHDLAEDLLGAMVRCSDWDGADDWTATIKFMMLMTDAPAHGMVPPCSVHMTNADKFSQIHPLGLSAESAAGALVKKGIDLFFCSFNPNATAETEARLAKAFQDHPDNTAENEVTCIPLVPTRAASAGTPALSGSQCQHIVFVLDESGSMEYDWNGVVAAYGNFVSKRLANQNSADLVSVVQFQSTARVTVNMALIDNVPRDLQYSGGGTFYSPAAELAETLALSTPDSHTPVVIFMSDGVADELDAQKTANIFTSLNEQVLQRWGKELELHVIAFGKGLDQRQLAVIMWSSGRGRIHTSVDTYQLNNIFTEIAESSSNVAEELEAEIGRRISAAVSDKVALEYLG